MLKVYQRPTVIWSGSELAKTDSKKASFKSFSLQKTHFFLGSLCIWSLVQNIVLVWPGSKVLLKVCLDLRFALESIDKIIHSISAQITVGFWLYYAYEDFNATAGEMVKNDEDKSYKMSLEDGSTGEMQGFELKLGDKVFDAVF